MPEQYKILVVDDEPDIRQLLKIVLEKDGYAVIEAENGEQAVELVKSDTSLSLVIMDIMMPELDGFSACREIRRTSNVPIIMLSARGEEYDKINGFELGIDDYVVKPFSPKELMLRVDAVMKRVNRASQAPVREPNHVIELDGGGHFDMAGAQVPGNVPEAYDRLTAAIDEYRLQFPEQFNQA